MICDQFDVVVVPFPFTDRAAAKRRPAVVLSSGKAFNRPEGHSIMAMIISSGNADWPGDAPLRDLKSAGLSSPCRVRLKLFTLDNRLIVRRTGALGTGDRAALGGSIGVALPL